MPIQRTVIYCTQRGGDDFLVDNNKLLVRYLSMTCLVVFQDVLVATTRGEPMRRGMKRLLYDEIDALSELRRKLDEMGLVADGSALISSSSKEVDSTYPAYKYNHIRQADSLNAQSPIHSLKAL
jgi:hypothetical protein